MVDVSIFLETISVSMFSSEDESFVVFSTIRVFSEVNSDASIS
jgi:hypothetical protein